MKKRLDIIAKMYARLLPEMETIELVDYDQLSMSTEPSGGCMAIWLKNKLPLKEKGLLFNYGYYINSFSTEFSIKFRNPVIKTEYEKRQILEAIGYLPVQEIYICGWANAIFPAFEAIMRRFGGYLHISVGADKEVYYRLKGHWHRIRKRTSYIPPIGISDYHLLDLKFLAEYFNELSDDKERDLFSLDNVGYNEFFEREIPKLKSPEVTENAPHEIEKRVFTCTKCGYSSQVFGEMYYDFGCYNYIGTLACKKCEELFEMVITKRVWDGTTELSLNGLNRTTLSFDLIDREEMICLRCGTAENHIWNKDENPCPKCNSEMTYKVEGKLRVKKGK